MRRYRLDGRRRSTFETGRGTWVALIEMTRLRPTGTVLVTSAAGGVGSAAVQLASAFGCRVLGAVGCVDKIDAARRLGASPAFEYRAIEKDVRDATAGRGVDVALELVGAGVYRSSFESLAPLRRIVVAGFSGRLRLQRCNPFSWFRLYKAVPRPDLMQMLRRSLAVASTRIGHLLSSEGTLPPIWSELAAFVTRRGIPVRLSPSAMAASVRCASSQPRCASKSRAGILCFSGVRLPTRILRGNPVARPPAGAAAVRQGSDGKNSSAF